MLLHVPYGFDFSYLYLVLFGFGFSYLNLVHHSRDFEWAQLAVEMAPLVERQEQLGRAAALRATLQMCPDQTTPLHASDNLHTRPDQSTPLHAPEALEMLPADHLASPDHPAAVHAPAATSTQEAATLTQEVPAGLQHSALLQQALQAPETQHADGSPLQPDSSALPSPARRRGRSMRRQDKLTQQQQQQSSAGPQEVGD